MVRAPACPREASLVADAEETLGRAHRQFGAPVLVIGESLGAGVASAVAPRQQAAVAGLLLITPWDRLDHVAAHHYPWLPVRWMLRDRYDSVEHLKAFDRPVVVVVAERDSIVPPQFGTALHASPGRPEAGCSYVEGQRSQRLVRSPRRRLVAGGDRCGARQRAAVAGSLIGARWPTSDRHRRPAAWMAGWLVADGRHRDCRPRGDARARGVPADGDALGDRPGDARAADPRERRLGAMRTTRLRGHCRAQRGALWGAVRLVPRADADSRSASSSRSSSRCRSGPRCSPPAFLGERLNLWKVIAVALGLLGVGLIVRPSADGLNPGQAIALAAALGFAVSLTLTKSLTRSDSAVAISFWMLVVQSVHRPAAGARAMALAVDRRLGLVLVVAFCGTFSHYCMARALRHADATVVVPMDFLRVPLTAVAAGSSTANGWTCGRCAGRC
jgi:hypothetical protein